RVLDEISDLLERHLHVRGDAGQRCTQFMRGDTQELIHAALTRSQRIFQTLPLGNVAGNLRGADDLPGSVTDRGDRERDIQQAAVFSSAHRLEMFDALPRAYAREDIILLARPFR